jgi:hypothetical protein
MNISTGISSNEVQEVVLILHNSTLERVSDCQRQHNKIRAVGRNQRWYPIETCNEYTAIMIWIGHIPRRNKIRLQCKRIHRMRSHQKNICEWT